MQNHPLRGLHRVLDMLATRASLEQYREHDHVILASQKEQGFGQRLPGFMAITELPAMHLFVQSALRGATI